MSKVDNPDAGAALGELLRDGISRPDHASPSRLLETALGVTANKVRKRTTASFTGR